MTNLKKKEFKDHPFHLVSLSQWPLNTSQSLFSQACSAVLTIHAFLGGTCVYHVVFASSVLFLLLSQHGFINFIGLTIESPPKPHSFVILPLQSSLAEAAMEAVKEVQPFIDGLYGVTDTTHLLARINNVDPQGPNAQAALAAYTKLMATGLSAETVLKDSIAFSDKTMHVMQGIIDKGNDITDSNLAGIQEKAIHYAMKTTEMNRKMLEDIATFVDKTK